MRRALFILVLLTFVAPASGGPKQRRSNNKTTLRGPKSAKPWKIIGPNTRVYRRRRGRYYSRTRPYRTRISNRVHKIVVVVRQSPKRTHKRSIIRPKPRVKIIINPFASGAKKTKPRPITIRARIIAESKAKAKVR